MIKNLNENLAKEINTFVCSTIDASNGVWLAHVNSKDNPSWYSLHLLFGEVYDYLIDTVKDKSGEFKRQLGYLIQANSQEVVQNTVFEPYPSHEISINQHLVEVEARLGDLVDLVSNLSNECSKSGLVSGNNLFSTLAEDLQSYQWKIDSGIIKD
jgi:DNA-binding ferritin-like protein